MLAQQVFSRFKFTVEMETDIRLIGEATLVLNRELYADSLFPRVAALLARKEYYTGLRTVLWPTDGNYRSYEDLLLCELIPSYKVACQAFYRDAGAKMGLTATKEQLHQCERVMLCALALSKELSVQLNCDIYGYSLNADDFVKTVRRSLALQGFPTFSMTAL
jgi:hypothetical protein